MPIQAQTADGMMHEFPDGTSGDVIDKAMADYTKNSVAGEPGAGVDATQGLNLNMMQQYPTVPIEAAKGVPVAGAFVPSTSDVDRFEKEQPGLAKAARGVGSAVALAPAIAAAPALFGAAPAASLLTNTVAGAGSAATLGALDSVAHGGSWGDMAKEGGESAVLGAAGPVVGKAIGAAFGGIMNLLKPEAKTALSNMNPLALKQAGAALKASGLTDEQIAAKMNELGPEGFLGELSPEMKGLTKAVATMPGSPEGKGTVISAFENRVNPEATRARIKQGLDDAMGPAENMATAKRELVEARTQGAKDPYEEWGATKITPTPEVKALVNQLDEHGLLDEARAVASRKSLASGEPVEPTENFFTTGDQKDWPTAASWDKIKQAVDKRIADSYNGYRPTEATRDYTQLKNRIDDVISNSSPEAHAKWMAARESWAAPSEVMRAQERGAGVWKNGITDDELLYELTNYSPAARAEYKKAARGALEEMMDSSVNGDTKVRNLLQGKNAADKFRIITGNKNINPETLLDQMKQETSHIAAKKDLGTTTDKEAFKQQYQQLQPNPEDTMLGRFEKRFPYSTEVFNPIRLMPGYGTVKNILNARQAAQFENARNVLGPLMVSKGPQALEYAKALNNYNPVPRGAAAGLNTSALIRALGQPQLTRPYPEAPQGYPYQSQ